LLVIVAFLAKDRVHAQSSGDSQQSATEAPAESASTAPLGEEQAERIVRSALEALETHRSISARMRFRVHVLGFSMFGNGIFTQGSVDDHLYRFELQMRVEDPTQKKVGDQTSILLHVCDGKNLWIHEHLPGQEEPSVTKIDVDATYFGLGSRRKAEGLGMFPRTPAIGGLARSLRELSAAFQFIEARATQLGDVNVWAVQGKWDEEHLAKLVPGADVASLPEQLPSYIVIYFGRDDLFPYRFDYFRRDREGASRTPMMTLELYEVRINGPLDAKQFTYQPGNFQDGTAAFSQKLDVSPVE